MKAVTITNATEPVQMADIAKPVSNKGECLIKIKYASLNRRDQWIREGKYPSIIEGTILGSDGCGVVEEGGHNWVGKSVIINPNIGWGTDPKVQAIDYKILGMPKNGTLGEYVVVNEDRLVEKPSHLTDEEAAAIPLAGLTAFRAIFTKAQIAKEHKVLVTGIGGGVAQFASQFAIATRAKVYVTSGDNLKISKACDQGVAGGFNYKDEDWSEQAAEIGGFDAIVDSAGGDLLNQYLKLIKPGGRIVMYGSTTGFPEKVDVFRMFWSQAQIMGSTMGNDQEFFDMVKFVEANGIKPTIDKVFEFDDYLSAFDRFKSKAHYGKIVLKVN